MTILIAIMLTSFIVNANQEEIIVKEVEYILMTETEYEEVYEDENELQSELVSLGMYEVTAYCACECVVVNGQMVRHLQEILHRGNNNSNLSTGHCIR